MRLYTRRDAQRGPITAEDGLENHLGGADAVNYRRYQLDLIAPHLGSTVLEVGAGMGDFSDQLADSHRLVLTDSDPACLGALRTRFAAKTDISVVELDLREPVSMAEPVDSVLMMNVLEHIEDDVTALERLAGVVRPGGTIVIWVPGYMSLYGDFDRAVGHFRRYTPSTVRQAVEGAGLRVRAVRPVNLLGGIAWWAAVRVGSASTPKSRMVRLYDSLVVPTTRAIESAVRPPFGQTVLCVAEVGAPE